MIQVVEQNGCKASLDVSMQRFKLDVHQEREGGGFLGGGTLVKPKLYSSLSQIDSKNFVSTAVLAAKAKCFDDGLYATVELMAQNGTASFAGKKHLLKSLVSLLQAAEDQSNGSAIIIAAACLSGLMETQRADVLSLLSKFQADPNKSKPLGFYTWTEELKRIFKQDRMLQSEAATAAWTGVVAALNQDLDLRRTYIDYLNMVAALSNPFAGRSLSARLLDKNLLPGDESFLPPSISPEYLLMKRLFMEGASFDTDIMEEIIKGLKDGSLDLTPGPNSGWYDYQIWSLAPLAIPEKMAEFSRLDLSWEYKQLLLKLFKGLYALTRETHAKQMGGLWGGLPQIPMMKICPELSVEPNTTYYLRRAGSYRFVRELLESSFGRESLAQHYRSREAGPPAQTLLAELESIERIFYGAHLVSCAELSLPYSEHEGFEGDEAKRTCQESFRSFASGVSKDADLGLDLRMMVPIAVDPGTLLVKVWMLLGWQAETLKISYSKQPEVVSFDGSNFSPSEPNARQFRQLSPDRYLEYEFGTSVATAAYPVFAEANVRTIFDRNEFRRLCNGYASADEIVKHLTAM